MDALEFLRERKRLCSSYKNCEGCQVGVAECVTRDMTSDDACKRIIAIVEQWSKEHPRKTRQSEFLKMFPNVILNDKGQPGFCPRTLDTAYHPVSGCVLDVDICQRCKDKFWGQEV